MRVVFPLAFASRYLATGGVSNRPVSLMEPLKVIPHADRASGDRHAAEKANRSPAGAGDSTPPAQRAAYPAAPRANTPRRVELTNPARIARPPVAPDAPTAQSFALSSGIRTLVVGLILVALVPNLTLAAVFWLGLINPPWSKPAQPPQPATQAATVPAVLTAPAMLEATAGEEVSFPIALDGTDGVPARSVIAISGLPQGSSFSDGRPYGDTEWNLKPDQIGDLHLVLPKTVSGEIKLAIRLITPDDKVIADAGTVLKVAPAPIEQPVAAGRNRCCRDARAPRRIRMRAMAPWMRSLRRSRPRSLLRRSLRARRKLRAGRDNCRRRMMRLVRNGCSLRPMSICATDRRRRRASSG